MSRRTLEFEKKVYRWLAEWALNRISREDSEPYDTTDINEALARAIEDRGPNAVRWIFLGIVLFLIDWLIPFYSWNLQAYGLYFDIIGAAFLVFPLIKGRTQLRWKAGSAAPMGLGGPRLDKESVSDVARDFAAGLFGWGMLLLGFSLQFISVVLQI